MWLCRFLKQNQRRRKTNQSWTLSVNPVLFRNAIKLLFFVFHQIFFLCFQHCCFKFAALALAGPATNHYMLDRFYVKQCECVLHECFPISWSVLCSIQCVLSYEQHCLPLLSGSCAVFFPSQPVFEYYKGVRDDSWHVFYTCVLMLSFLYSSYKDISVLTLLTFEIWVLARPVCQHHFLLCLHGNHQWRTLVYLCKTTQYTSL